ncbi:MAG: tRNA preQ1(34) S-adenosylmethionine ribosyltransferase-isomerase QueA [Deltaproteobacteria bacterium CG11_big_fil_rev_8_21_14_0_20_49_13]|nr:MAG: tRNA preQ1(34) S-adenosylmethionine ribosyltransferase-isomerase QueA [Deltaproteobacteria bacterium CG11_big_fil_rev_8_21_14_0_20_49_13]
MKLSDFSYEFPEGLIATEPMKDRDASRMMVVNRSCGTFEHSFVHELPSFLKRGDVLVVNDTRVFPARLIGKKESGGYFEILLLRPQTIDNRPKRWRCITNQTKTARPGLKILFGDELVGTFVAREGEELIIEFNDPELIERVGLPPVPPYIRKMRDNSPLLKDGVGAVDKERYQTIYAMESGSAAAPTAGLHFTDDLLKKIESLGVKLAKITLHVGLDTFSPVRVENIEEHKMHGEEYFVPEETVMVIENAKKEGGRVIAIGTTGVRALESACPLLCKEERGDVDVYPTQPPLTKGRSVTNLFITPGYKFRVIDAIFTNFHQPESTLLMMVSAFAGRRLIMKAYKEAIAQRYRLFSYGDSMFIL